MYDLNLSNDTGSFLRKLVPKHYKQVVSKILDLLKEPFPEDSKKLTGYDFFYRVDIGEYRIIYRVVESKNEMNGQVKIALVGKRNDDDVYKKFKRKF